MRKTKEIQLITASLIEIRDGDEKALHEMRDRILKSTADKAQNLSSDISKMHEECEALNQTQTDFMKQVVGRVVQ